MSAQNIRIITLSENTAGQMEVLGEHGLSFLIEVDGEALLFDTGQTGVFLDNAKALDVDLSSVRTVVLSHGHQDHSGGLERLLRDTGEMDILAHPDALLPKYAVPKEKGERTREIGLPWSEAEIERIGGRFRLSAAPRWIAEDVLLTGQVPRRTDFECVSDRFRTKRNGDLVQDELLDDQTLVVRTRDGLVVICGCAHSGVINTLQYAVERTGEERIVMLLGGIHLVGAKPERIERTVQEFERFDIGKIAVSHCTGWKACCRMYRAFGDRFVPNNVGGEIRL